MASAASSSSTYANSPCAACKFLRRKCLPDCIFAPYFPPEEPQKFANVHKIFGASNVSKLLNEVLPHQREDAVNSLAYEAEARLKDPVYGCVGAISVLQRQVIRLQKELDATNADLIRFAYGNANNTTITTIRNSSSSTATATTTATDQMMISSAGAYREDPSSAERSSSSILHQGGVYYGGNYGLWSGGIDEANGRGGGNGSF